MRNRIVLSATLALLLPLAARAADFYWANGGTGDWTNTANWESPLGTPAGALPGSGDNVFIQNGGTARLTGSRAMLDLNVSNGSSITTSVGAVNLTVNDDLNVSGTGSINPQITVVMTNSGGSGSFNLTATISSGLGSLTVSDSTLVTALSINSDLVLQGSLNVTAGTVNTNGNAISVGGNWTVATTATFTAAGGTVTFTGAAPAVDGGGSAFSSVTYSGGGTMTITRNITISGTLTISSGTVDFANFTFSIGTLSNNGTLELDGTQNPQTITTMDTNSGTVRYNGATGGTIRIASFFDLVINSAGDTFTLNQATVVNDDLNITAGTLDVSASNFQLTVAGDWIGNGASSVFNDRAGLVILSGTGWLRENDSFNNLRITGGTRDVDISGLTVAGALQVNGGTLDANALNVTVAGLFTLGGGTFTAGSGSHQLNGGATFTSGTLNGNTATIQVTGNWNDTGITHTGSSGTVRLAGGGTITQAAANDFFHLIIDNAYSMSSALDVNGNLTINATRTLTTNNNTIDVEGTIQIDGTLTAGTGNQVQVGTNWTNNGTFNRGTSTVVFDTASVSQVRGSNYFYNLTSATPGKTLQFQDGVTQRVENNLTITGNAGSTNVITLESISGGTWTIQLDANTESVAYAVVRNSGVAGSVTLTATASRNDGGNTLGIEAGPPWGWFFPPTVLAWTGAANDGDWDNGANWNQGYPPNTGDIVNMPNAGDYTPRPALSASLTVAELFIDTAAQLDVGGFDLTVSTANQFDLQGSLYRNGSGETVPQDDEGAFSGTMVYKLTAGGAIVDYGATDYFNLRVAGGSFSVGAALTVANNLTVDAGGSLALAAQTTSVTGTVSNAGTLSSSGAISSAAFTSTGTFNNTGVSTIDASGNVTISGTFSNPSNNTLTMTGAGPALLNASVTIGDLVVPAAASVQLAANLALADDLTIASGGALDVSATGYSIQVAGDFTVTAPGGAFNARTGTAAAVTFNGAGTQTVTSNGGSFNNVAVSSAGATTVQMQDALTVGGTLSIAASDTLQTQNFNLSVTAATTIAATGTLNASAMTAGRVLDFGGDLTVAGTLNNSGAGALNAAGATVDFSGGTYSAGTGTFTFDGGIAQTFSPAANSFGNTAISGAGTAVSLVGAAATFANLSIEAGASLSTAQDLTVTGNWTNSGTQTISGGTVSFTGTGTQTVTSNGGSFNNVAVSSAGATTVQMQDALTVGGTLSIAASDTLQTQNFNLSVTAATTIAATGTLNASAMTAGRVLDFGGDLTVAGTLNNSGAGALNAAGATVDFSGGTYSAGTGTFTFDGGIAQTFSPAANSFGNTAISGAGTAVSLVGAAATFANLGIGAGASLSTAQDLTVTGNWTNSGTQTISGGTVSFTGTGTQTVTSNGGSFNNVAVSSAGATTVQMQDALTVGGTLSIAASDTLQTQDFNLSVTAATTIAATGTLNASAMTAGRVLDFGGSLTVAGTLNNSGAGALNAAGATVDFSGGTYSAGTGTFTFDGGIAQTFSPAANSFGNTAISGAGTAVSLVGAAATFANLSIEAGASLSTAQDLTVTGNWTNSGTQTISGGTVSFTGTGTQTVTSNGGSFNNVAVSSAGATTVQMQDALTVGGTLSIAASDTLQTQNFNLSVTAATTIAATGTLNASAMTAGRVLDFGGDLTVAGTLNNSGAGALNVAGAAVDFTGGTYSAGTGTFTFDGVGLQQLTSDGQDLGDVAVSSAGATTVQMQDALTVGGTLSIAASDTLQTQNFNLSVTAATTIAATGTLNASAMTAGRVLDFGGDLTVAGTLNNSGAGALNAAGATVDFSGGTYSAGTGTFTFDGGIAQTFSPAANSFGNTAISGAGTAVSLVGAAATFANLSIEAGASLSTAQDLTVTGNWTNSGTQTISGGTVSFTGTGTQTVTSNGGSFNNVAVSSAGATTVQMQDALTVGGTLSIAASDTLQTQNFNLSVTAATTIAATGTLNASAMTAGRVLDFGGDLTVAGTLNNSGAGALNAAGATVDFSGGTYSAGTGTFTFDRGAAQAFTPNGQDYNAMALSGAGTTVTMTATATVSSLAIAAGTSWRMDASGGDCTLLVSNAGSISNAGSFVIASGALAAGNRATIQGELAGNTWSYSGTDIDYNATQVVHLGDLANYGPAVSLVGSEQIVLVDSCIFDSTITVNGAGAAITVGAFVLTTTDDNVTVTQGTISVGTGTGTGRLTTDSPAGGGAGSLSIAAAGVVTLADNDTIATGSAAITNSGTLSSDGAISSGAFTSTATFNNTGVNTITAAGSVTISGTFSATTTDNTLTMTGAATTLDASVPIGHLAVASGASVALANDLTASGTITVASGGSFDVSAAAHDIQVAGNFTVSGPAGTFNARAGTAATVTFNGTGTQTLRSNGQSFNNVAVSSAGATTVQMQDALTVGGTLSIAASDTLQTQNFNLSVTAATTIAATGTLNASAMTAGRVLDFGGDLTVAGTLNNSGAGALNAAGATVDFTGGTYSAGTGTFTFDRGAAQAFTPNGQDYNAMALSGAGTTVTMTATATVSSLAIAAGTSWRMDASGGDCTLLVSNAGSISNAGSFVIASGALAAGNRATIQGELAGNTWSYSGTDIDYNATQVVHLGDLANYGPAVSLVGSEQIVLVDSCIFDSTITVNGAGAAITVGAFVLTTTDDNVTVTQGTISVGTGTGTGRLTTDSPTGGGAGSLSIAAAGVVTLADNDTIATGSAAITNSGTLSSDGAISSGAFTSTATFNNTGVNTITAAGSVTISGTFSATTTDNTLTMTGAATTLDASVPIGHLVINTAGTVNLSATNDLEVDGSLWVQAGTFTAPASRNVTVDGLANIDGTLNFSANGHTLTLNGDLDCDGSLANAGDGVIRARGNVDFTGAGSYTKGSGTFIFDSGAARSLTSAGEDLGDIEVQVAGTNLTLADAADFDDVTITAGTLSTAANVRVAGNWSNSGAMAFTAGTTIFDGAGPTQSVTSRGGAFFSVEVSSATTTVLLAGAAGEGDFEADGNFRITAGAFDVSASNHEVRVAGNWTNVPGAAAFIERNGAVVFDGNGAIQTSAETFYSLHKDGAGTTTSYDVNLTVTNMVHIIAGTLRDGGGRTLLLQGGTWRNDAGNPGFAANGGTVELDDPVFPKRILGSTTFADFVCDQPVTANPLIIFEADRGSNIVQTVTSDFRVVGTPGNRIVLTSDWGVFVAPYAYPPPPPVQPQQWQINITGIATIDYIVVELSFGVTPVTPGPNTQNGGFAGIPGTAGWTSAGFGNCHQWLFVIPIEASWAIDADGNGRIDRIRVLVEPGTQLSDNYAPPPKFTVVVTDYEVLGFDAGVANDDVFDILLQEKPYLDTDVRPTWQLLTNDQPNGLYGLVGGAYVEASLTKVYTAEDGARPVIAYTLAVAGEPRAYLHFSEPVWTNAANTSRITASDFGSTLGAPSAVSALTLANEGTHDAMLSFASAVTEADILAPATVNALAGAVFDQRYKSALEDPRSDPQNYMPGSNLNYDGNLSPGTKPMLNTVTHRVSDVGLGLIAPVWASDQVTTRDPVRGGIGRITTFNGSGWLQDLDVLLQARVSAGLENETVDLHFDVGAASPIRSGNLWLPVVTPTAGPILGDTAHNPNTAARSVGGAPAAPLPSPLRDFVIPENDPELRDGADLEFLFVVNGFPYADVGDRRDPRTARVWAWAVRGIRTQRGEVTIMNNVINPDRGERTSLHYVLEDSGTVTITVFDLKGDIVDVLYRGHQSQGEHSTTWDGRNRGSAAVARGVYFIKLVGPGVSETRKVLVVR